jgi:hypothetical protein
LNPAVVNRQRNHFKIHRFAQLYKDAYELQRYFIQKRDELCKNGEFILSGALSYKLSSLDSHVTSLIGSLTQSFDESEALLVENRYKALESKLSGSQSAPREHTIIREGDFYYIDRGLIVNKMDKSFGDFPSVSANQDNLIICVLKVNSDSSKFIAQVYLRPNDDQFIDIEAKKFRKFFSKEIFKSDLYVLLEANEVSGSLKPCFVMGMKDFLNNEPTFDTTVEPDTVAITKNDIFVCESLYSTCFRYFRKIINKKWCPLSFINGTVSNATSFNFSLVKRSLQLTVVRNYLNESLVEQISHEIETRVNQEQPMKIRQFFRDVQYDTPPAAALQASKEKDADEIDANAVDEDPELMKTAKYYEQLVYQRTGEIYKLGDFIYVKYQQLTNSNDPSMEHKHPLIVRIDRLWSTTTQSPEDPSVQVKNYNFRGPLFLRPTDVAHEPTRLFYKNEVVKEITKQITGSIDQIVVGNTGTGSTKCVVMNHKSYVSSRLTEIDERDVYLCDSKYSLVTKAFRKGTKGLKKFELSAKCNEDEIFFLRRELQLRKQLSPLLVNMEINYDEDYTKANEDEEMDDEWDDDENSSQSYPNENSNMDSASFLMGASASPSVGHVQKYHPSSQRTSINPKTKQQRVKREKKSGYNIFSREFRRKLRESNSSLPFNAMGKEVGRRWSALSDKEKAAYEEQARIESIAEAEKRAQEQKLQQQQEQQLAQQKQAQQQQLQQQQQQQQPQFINSPQHPTHINNILAGQQVVQQGGAVYINQAQGHPQVLQQITNVGGKPSLILYQNGAQIQTQPVQQVQQGGYIIQQNVGMGYPTAQIINQQGQPVQQMQPLPQQQPTQIIYDQPVVKQQPETAKQISHKEAYIKYIANIKKQQNFYASNAYLNPTSYINHVHNADWRREVDIDPSRVKENKLSEAPQAWIENCSSDDLVAHLTKLRYYLVNDAVNIDRHPVLDEDGCDIDEGFYTFGDAAVASSK